MSSYAATEAERVKTILQAGVDADAFSIDFTVKRVYSPLVDLASNPSALDDLQALVTPRDSTTRERLDRGGTQRKTLQIDVGVLQKLEEGLDPFDETGNAWLDARVEVAEQVADYFTQNTDSHWIATEHVLVDPTKLREDRVFFSLITLSVNP